MVEKRKEKRKEGRKEEILPLIFMLKPAAAIRHTKKKTRY